MKKNQNLILLLVVAGLKAKRELTMRLQRHGLGLTSYRVLQILARKGQALTNGEIEAALWLSRPDTSDLVDRLINKDLVSRGRDAHDQRLVRVSITERGLQLLDHLNRIVSATSDQLSVDIDPAVVDLVEGALSSVLTTEVVEW